MTGYNADDGIDPGDEIARLRAEAADHERRATAIHGRRNDLLVLADALGVEAETTEAASLADMQLARAYEEFFR